MLNAPAVTRIHFMVGGQVRRHGRQMVRSLSFFFCLDFVYIFVNGFVVQFRRFRPHLSLFFHWLQILEHSASFLVDQSAHRSFEGFKLGRGQCRGPARVCVSVSSVPVPQ